MSSVTRALGSCYNLRTKYKNYSLLPFENIISTLLKSRKKRKFIPAFVDQTPKLSALHTESSKCSQVASVKKGRSLFWILQEPPGLLGLLSQHCFIGQDEKTMLLYEKLHFLLHVFTINSCCGEVGSVKCKTQLPVNDWTSVALLTKLQTLHQA